MTDKTYKPSEVQVVVDGQEVEGICSEELDIIFLLII